MVETLDHVYVWPQTYTCHTYSFTYRLYFFADKSVWHV